MTPLTIRRERCAEVIRLVCRLSRYDEENKPEGSETVTRGGKRVIRRPAGDDWF